MKPLFTIVLLFLLKIAQTQTLNFAERPLPQHNMPRFAKLMYQKDVAKINFFAVEKAFNAWHTEELKDRKANAFEENIYEEYYNRWAHAVMPYVQADGSIQWPTAEELALKDNERRQVYEADVRKSQNATTRSPLSNWTLIGPTKTIFDIADRSDQHNAPWQINAYAIDIAPSNNSILYAASETGAMNKTTDKGLTWSPVGQGFFTRTQTAIAIHPTDPNTVYTGDNNGVNLSIDGGTTWSNSLSVTSFSCNDIAIKPDAPSVILAAGTSLRRYNGSAWSNVLSRTIYDLEFKTDDPSVVFALTRNATTDLCEFWKSTDGGATFTVRSAGWISGLTDGGGRLAVSAANSSVIYAILLTGSGTRFAKSTDAGESWTITDLSNTLTYTTITSWDKTGGQGYYDLSIMASPTDANKVIFGVTSAYRSIDGGTTWAAIGGYTSGFDIHPDIQEMKSAGNDAWITTDGGTTYSSDFFGTDAQYRIVGLTGVHFWGFDNGWNEDVLVGGRYHNGNTARHENYAAGTYLRMGGGEAATGYVNPANNKMTYYSDIGGYVISASSNIAPTYFAVSKFPNESYYSMDYSEIKFDPRYSQTFLLGNGNQVWKTTDNGVNFSSLYTSSDAAGYVMRVEIARSNPSVIYFCEKRASDGKIYKSINGGTSWTVCTDPTGLTASQRRSSTIAVSGSDANTLWAAYRSGPNGNKIFKSTDGGTSWTNLTTTTLNGVNLSDMTHQLGTNGGIYLIGDYGKVFYRNNAMSDWTAYSTGLPVALNGEISRIKLNYKKNKARIASSMGIWEADLFETSTTSFAQPIVDKATSTCSRDTFSFSSYSVENGAATYAWTITPTPQYISSSTAQSPKVVLGNTGNYTVNLSLTDANGTVSQAVTNMVSIPTDYCAITTTPTQTGTFTGVASSNAKSVKPAPNFGGSQDFTVSFWFKSATTSSDAAMVSDKNWNSGGYNGWVFSLSSGEIWFNIGDDQGHRIDLHSVTTYNDNVWHHAAASVTRTGNAVLYVDGVNKVSTSAAALLDIYSGYPLAIGSDPNNNYPYAGKVDEVKIWSAALSQNQIRENMHLTATASEANLIDYYQFNDATTNEYDRGGNVNNLTLSSAASRTASTAPIGGGMSFRMTVNASGEKIFAGTDVKLTFSASGTLPNGELVVSQINNSPDQVPTAALSSMSRYYVVRNWGTNATFAPLSNLTFENLGTFANGIPSDYKLYKRSNNAEGATWGTAAATATASSPTTNGGFLTFGTGNNVTSFSQLVLSRESALPVELLDFQCVAAKTVVNLTWNVATQFNTEGYQIERSTDGGQTFEGIGFIKAKAATGKTTAYAFTDEKPIVGTNYYRLKMLDTDGKFDFSPIRTAILRGPDLDKFSIYPNPASRSVTIDFDTNRKGRVEIELVDVTGKLMLKTHAASDIGINQFPINVSKVAEGTYFLKMTDGVTVSVQRLVVVK